MLSAEKIRAIHETVDQEKVAIAFQPISDIAKRRLIAYEALARPVDPIFTSVPEMFEAAVQAGRVAELGRIHREWRPAVDILWLRREDRDTRPRRDTENFVPETPCAPVPG